MKKLYNTLTQTFLPNYPRADNEPIAGLDPSLVVYEVLEEPQPAMTSTQYLTRTEVADHTAKTLTLGWQIHEQAALPVIVSMTSLRLALIDAGLYQIITSAINNIADATEKLKAQTWWATAQNVRRDHPLVAGIAALAGRSDQQVDAIFAAAKALDNLVP